MTTPLGRELKTLIRSNGPIPLSAYMALCLGHPRCGYYMTRDPLGENGDFITAPEISQMFGELLGLWSVAVWQAMGEPDTLRLIECGPGRGTLMKDALRAARALPGFAAAVSVHLVEMSPVLAAIQAETLKDCGAQVAHHASLDQVPPGPTILLANEFLDALPIRQFEKRDGRFFERMVGLEGEAFALGLSPEPAREDDLPPSALRARDGDIVETCPAVEPICHALARRAEQNPLASLFIDYGHDGNGIGDTFQAVRRHAFVDPLAEPGEADITAHVDFAGLARMGLSFGLVPSQCLSQADFLEALGVDIRATALGRANADKRAMIEAARDRLIAREDKGMGSLFKVLALSSEGLTLPYPPRAA